MKRKKMPNKFFLYSAIVASFLLAILDMMFLRDVFIDYLNFELVPASIISFALATAANTSALVWGKQKGSREGYRGFMYGWIFLGIAYAILRSIAFYQNVIEVNDWSFEAIIEQLVPAIILAISYIGTGTMIQWASAKIWDIDVVNFLETRKAFKAAHAKIVNNKAVIKEMAKRLEEYSKNYDYLDHQYNIHMGKILKSEQSTISLIVAKTIAEHPEISPSEAENVKNMVLKERDIRNENAHAQQK